MFLEIGLHAVVYTVRRHHRFLILDFSHEVVSGAGRSLLQSNSARLCRQVAFYFCYKWKSIGERTGAKGILISIYQYIHASLDLLFPT